jgi:crotonobetainyl-CoA:carnitine CoA-transferase CaiB-like acyl-CoA transferase
MTGALSNIRVLDLGTFIAGPYCATLLGEFGAEVIKIEPTEGGDALRKFGTETDCGDTLVWLSESRNKKCVTLNLRTSRGIELLKGLIAHADVVVENFKPGVIKQMGMGFEALQALKPGMILCSISALGQTGPLSAKPGYDYIAQAYAGVTSMIGDPDQPPFIPLLGIGDVSTGVHAALAIAAPADHCWLLKTKPTPLPICCLGQCL